MKLTASNSWYSGNNDSYYYKDMQSHQLHSKVQGLKIFISSEKLILIVKNMRSTVKFLETKDYY